MRAVYDYIVYLICAFVFFKTLSYSVWSFKNTGALGGAAALAVAVLCLAPIVLMRGK